MPDLLAFLRFAAKSSPIAKCSAGLKLDDPRPVASSHLEILWSGRGSKPIPVRPVARGIARPIARPITGAAMMLALPGITSLNLGTTQV